MTEKDDRLQENKRTLQAALKAIESGAENTVAQWRTVFSSLTEIANDFPQVAIEECLQILSHLPNGSAEYRALWNIFDMNINALATQGKAEAACEYLIQAAGINASFTEAQLKEGGVTEDMPKRTLLPPERQKAIEGLLFNQLDALAMTQPSLGATLLMKYMNNTDKGASSTAMWDHLSSYVFTAAHPNPAPSEPAEKLAYARQLRDVEEYLGIIYRAVDEEKDPAFKTHRTLLESIAAANHLSLEAGIPGDNPWLTIPTEALPPAISAPSPITLPVQDGTTGPGLANQASPPAVMMR